MKKIFVAAMLVLAGAGFLAAQEPQPTAAKADFEMPKEPVMVMETTQGTIKIKLFPDVAPLACENFIRLAEKGYYDGLIFHRIIKGFMVQGGDPKGNGTGGQSIWTRPFKDEFSDKVKFDRKGLLAMANRGPGTNGSQFFITVAPTSWLSGKHTIFGEVVEGYDVVEKLENVKTEPKLGKPVEEQKIIKLHLDKPVKESEPSPK